MTQQRAQLDGKFVEKQRGRLEALRERALAARDSVGLEDQDLQRQRGEPGDIADRGADLTQRDIERSVDHVETLRLAEIERALEKIEEGTYGVSDDSGEPIPKARLEARPEAVRTVEEEQEEERRPGSDRGRRREE